MADNRSAPITHLHLQRDSRDAVAPAQSPRWIDRIHLQCACFPGNWICIMIHRFVKLTVRLLTVLCCLKNIHCSGRVLRGLSSAPVGMQMWCHSIWFFQTLFTGRQSQPIVIYETKIELMLVVRLDCAANRFEL